MPRASTTKKTAPKKAQQIDAAIPEESKDLATAPSFMEQDAGGGFEQTNAEDYAIPFLKILQSGSPQLKRSEGEYIEGAREGDIFNTVTREVYEELRVVCCAYKRAFIEWRPDRGGFVKQWDTEPKPTDLSDPDNEVNDTRMHYVIALTDEGPRYAVMSMSSTQIKKSRKWMSTMSQLKAGPSERQFTPPMWASMFHVSTVPESNDQGSWMGWEITRIGWVTDQSLYNEARAFHQAVTAGDVNIRHDDMQDAAPEDEGF